MFAALYGRFIEHGGAPDWDADPYALFYRRSLAMGWLDDLEFHPRVGVAAEVRPGGAGLWSMNDAGFGEGGPSSDTWPALWFQIGVDPLPTERPLPTQPFLRCAGDAASQLGVLDLQAVQVLLPLQVLGDASDDLRLSTSLVTADWFSPRTDSHSLTSVRLTLEGGAAADLGTISVDDIVADVNGCDQRILTLTIGTDKLGPLIPPPFPDYFWGGPVSARVGLEGDLYDWSLDAIGWLAGFLGDICARRAIHSPLLLTVART
ncbi:hypothetical protein ACPPVT_22210 [Angustibacter sp. McL0619]|uniref:hypothetical protein n=1 Tax=Angustibacter sp. McL0619 TaxID=3415676 RepID=UPI003CEB2644